MKSPWNLPPKFDNVDALNERILMLKDITKKSNGFLETRKRIPSVMDANLEAIFKQISNLQSSLQPISKLRIIPGSDMIEIRYITNPFNTVVYNTEEFLGLDINKFQAPIELNPVPKKEIKSILNGLVKLRERDMNFLEAYRLNSLTSNLWLYFSSSESRMCTGASFLEKMRHKSKNVYGVKIGSDKEFFLRTEVIRKKLSLADKHEKEILSQTDKLFQEDKIFEFQLYSGSGLIRVLQQSNPYEHQFFSVEEFLTKDLVRNRLEHTSKPNPTININNDRLEEILCRAKNHREDDEHIYLRVFYADLISDKVVISYSCGGTYCLSSKDYLTQLDF